MNYFYLDKYNVLHGVEREKTAREYAGNGRYIEGAHMVDGGYPAIVDKNEKICHIRVYTNGKEVTETIMGEEAYCLEENKVLNEIVVQLLER